MQSLVTGGAGFIGSHLVEELVRRGDSVRVLDNLSTGELENLSSVVTQIELIEGDIRDRNAVASAVADADRVFHLAALVSVPLSVADPLADHAVNVDGTLNVLEASREYGVRSFVYASSAAVYGDAGGLPKIESMTPAPISPYGLAKSIDERYAQLYFRLYGLRTVGLRYFNVYGPRQSPSSPYSGVISLFVDRLLSGARPTIHGDGMQTRDFVFVSDVVSANLLAAETEEAAGEVFNVSTDRATSILELWETLSATAGVALRPRFTEERAGDVRHSRASFGKAGRLMGFAPRVPLAEGLRRTFEWYRMRHDRS